MSVIYLDCEYSSFYSADKNKSGDLLQLGAAAVVNGEIHTFLQTCRPVGRVWNLEAEKVHGISKARALKFQPQQMLAKNFVEWVFSLGDHYFTPKGWNCRNDKLFVERLMFDHNLDKELFSRMRVEWIDVMAKAKEREEFLGSKSLKLGDVAGFFKIELDAHNALSDALATMKVDECLTGIVLPKKEYKKIDVSECTNAKDKILKYMSSGYVQIGSRGDVYISEHATADKEALQVIFSELYNRFVIL